MEITVPAMLIQNPALAIPRFDSGERPCLIASISIFPRIAPGIPAKNPQQKTLMIPSTKEITAFVLFEPVVGGGGGGPGGMESGMGGGGVKGGGEAKGAPQLPQNFA